MLTIRSQQLLSFQENAREQFIDRMCAYTAEEHSEWHKRQGDAKAREFVTQCVERAKTHRIETKGAVAIYIDLTLQYGDDFDRSPDRAWAMKTLAHPALPDYVRMEAIQERLESKTQGRKLRVANGGDGAP